MPLDKYQLEVELAKVVDPEINVSIMELNLIDKLDIHEDGLIDVQYHATTPYCPAFFALQISQDIRERLSKLGDVKQVNVILTGHYMSEYINKLVAEGKP